MRREGTRDGGREETVEGGQETKGRQEAAGAWGGVGHGPRGSG